MNYCEEKGISTSELNEAQRTLYFIAENMKMDKSISEEGYEHFQQAIKALEQQQPMVENNLYSVIKQSYIEREVLEKLRTEVEQKLEQEEFARSVFRHEEKDYTKAEQCTGSIMAYRNVLKMFDKYREESEVSE